MLNPSCSSLGRVPHPSRSHGLRSLVPRLPALALGPNTGRSTSVPVAAAPSLDACTSKVSAASLDQLRTWSASRGVSVDKVAAASDIQDMDAGVLTAARDIASGEAILSVPESAWLAPSTISQRAPTYAKLVAGCEPWLQIAVALMVERAQVCIGKKSEWEAYLASLPASLSTPLLWTPEQQALLAGTQLEQSLLGYKSFFAQTYAELQASVFAQNPSIFPAEYFTEADFMWAAAAVRMRLRAPLDTEPMALVPLADAVSHKRVGNARWQLKSGGLFNRSQNLVVEATRPIRQGETISMDVGGGKSDNVVLLDFGAMDMGTPQAGYQLTLSLLENERFPDDKIDVMERNGYQSEMTFSLSPTSFPSVEMMAYLRLVHLSGLDGFLLEPVFQKEVWGFLQEPVSEGNERAVCQAITAGARVALSAYPTSLVEDRDLIRSGELKKGSREEQAVLVRLGEKECLDNALRFFEDRESRLKELEYYQERRLKRLGLLDSRGKSTYDGFFEDGIA